MFPNFNWVKAIVRCSWRDGLRGKTFGEFFYILYTKTDAGWWVKTPSSDGFVDVPDCYHDQWNPDKTIARYCSKNMIAVKIPKGWVVITHGKPNDTIQIVQSLPMPVTID